jgi:hypothetical protein
LIESKGVANREQLLRFAAAGSKATDVYFSRCVVSSDVTISI